MLVAPVIMEIPVIEFSAPRRTRIVEITFHPDIAMR